MKSNSARHKKKKHSQEVISVHKVSDRLKSLIGSVKLPKYFDEKKELKKYYQSKY